MQETKPYRCYLYCSIISIITSLACCFIYNEIISYAPTIISENNAKVKGRLVVLDYNGKERISLDARDSTTPMIQLHDKNGTKVIVLAVASENAPGLAMKDSSGSNRLLLGLSSAGVPAIIFADKDGKYIKEIR